MHPHEGVLILHNSLTVEVLPQVFLWPLCSPGLCEVATLASGTKPAPPLDAVPDAAILVLPLQTEKKTKSAASASSSSCREQCPHANTARSLKISSLSRSTALSSEAGATLITALIFHTVICNLWQLNRSWLLNSSPLHTCKDGDAPISLTTCSSILLSHEEILS